MSNTNTTPSTDTAPEIASLWQVDHRGEAINKPFMFQKPLKEVQKMWVDMVNCGVDPTGIRITEGGKRPDKLGRRP